MTDPVRPPVHSRAYSYYVLVLLTSVYALNLLDRSVVALLLQSIKQDLHLTDTELGFITGIAFALFYATLGLPIARLADRANRAVIAALAIGTWAVTVMCSVFVSNFAQLAAARVAAAVGESGCKPPTYSLVGDYFPEPKARTIAMSVYWLGSPIASLIAFGVGGWLNEVLGWRTTLLVMGIPGLLLAALVALTVRDPRADYTLARPATVQIGFGEVLRLLWTRQSLRHLCLAIVLLYAMGVGLGPWYAAFMIRSHGMGTAELGVWLGLIFGFGGIIGSLSGAYVMSTWLGENEASQMKLTAVVVASLVPWFLAFLCLPNKYEALASLLPLIVTMNFFLAPAYVLLQRLVPDEMRATTLAIVMLLANLFGMGLGPQVIGILSDLLHPVAGADSLRYAMLSMTLIAAWAGFHFWKVGSHIGSDLRSMGDDYHWQNLQVGE